MTSVSEWETVSLRDVLALDVETVDVIETGEYPIVGVLNRGRGLLYRDPIRGADTAYKTLNVLRAKRVVYSRLKAFEGAITVTPNDMQVRYASAEFPTFRCGPGLLPEYFALVTTTPSLWDRLQNLSTGMGGRRERVKPSAFLGIKLRLPHPAEQRRIATVMSAVDSQIKALEAEIVGAQLAMTTLRIDVMKMLGSERQTLGEIADVKLGRMLSRERSEGNDQAPYIRNANVQWSGLDLSDLKTMSFPIGDRESYRILRGDILVCEGGDPGRCVLVDRDLEGIFYQKAVHRVRAISLDPEFLYQVLVWAYETEAISALCTSTTIQHLTAEKFRTLRLPVGTSEEQRCIGALLSGFGKEVNELNQELTALRCVRSDLLTALLSQEITVDEAVDQLVEGAA